MYRPHKFSSASPWVSNAVGHHLSSRLNEATWSAHVHKPPSTTTDISLPKLHQQGNAQSEADSSSPMTACIAFRTFDRILEIAMTVP